MSFSPRRHIPPAPEAPALLGARRAHPEWERWQDRAERACERLQGRLKEAGKVPGALAVRLVRQDGSVEVASVSLPARPSPATVRAAALGLLRRALEPVVAAELARWELVAWQLTDGPEAPADFGHYYARRHGHAPGTPVWRAGLAFWGRRLRAWALQG